MSSKSEKKERKEIRKTYKAEAQKGTLTYFNTLLKGKGFFGRLHVAWRILRCRV